MMENKEVLEYCIDSLKKSGIEKVQCNLIKSKKHEINVDSGEISLFRTIFDTDLHITGIKNNRRGNISINKTDQKSLEEAIRKIKDLIDTSEVDEAYDIAASQEAREFTAGLSEPDLDRMYDLLDGFIVETETLYPDVRLEQLVFQFNEREKTVQNSNNVDLKSRKGVYGFTAMFSSKNNEKTTSFNHTSFSTDNLEKELIECGTLKDLLKQSVEHLKAKPMGDKFTGEIIITPDCLRSVIEYYSRTFLRDGALISGSSPFRDKLKDKVASEKFTLYSRPVADEIANGYFITGDGYIAEDLTVVDRGVLNSFLLSQYGANKTNHKRAKNTGGAYVVESGDKSLADIIKNIDRGILMARFSGGNPGPNGDFSGVAKNSFYIEEGEVQYPLSETMVAGNLAELFMNVKDISRESINFGSAIMPWVCSTGITISGK